MYVYFFVLNFPPVRTLLDTVRLFILKNFPACTFLSSCTFICFRPIHVGKNSHPSEVKCRRAFNYSRTFCGRFRMLHVCKFERFTTFRTFRTFFDVRRPSKNKAIFSLYVYLFQFRFLTRTFILACTFINTSFIFPPVRLFWPVRLFDTREQRHFRHFPPTKI